MITFIVVITMILYMGAVGYFVVNKINALKIGEKQGDKPEVQALVYGLEEAEEIQEELRSIGVEALQVKEATYKKEWQKTKYFIAVSQNDGDNLSFCTIASKLYQPIKVIGLCNEIENKKLFEKNGIPTVASVYELRNHLLPSIMGGREL